MLSPTSVHNRCNCVIVVTSKVDWIRPLAARYNDKMLQKEGAFMGAEAVATSWQLASFSCALYVIWWCIVVLCTLYIHVASINCKYSTQEQHKKRDTSCSLVELNSPNGMDGARNERVTDDCE